jgi:hypothetical protein
MTQMIIVWDPIGSRLEGEVVSDVQALQLAARGVVLLPATPRLFQLSGVGGFTKRSWGDGQMLDMAIPKLNCPLTIYLAKELRTLHWAVRLVPASAAARAGLGARSGQLRLTADGNQPGVVNASYQPEGSPVDLRALPDADMHGGWTITGKGIVSPSGDGYAGFALYGAGAGVRVLWAALTQAEV